MMESIDAYVPDPVRALDKPFSMPVEDVFSIQVRGGETLPGTAVGGVGSFCS